MIMQFLAELMIYKAYALISYMPRRDCCVRAGQIDNNASLCYNNAKKGGGYMKKIYNPKLLLYLFLPFVGMLFGCLFIVVENYIYGSVFCGLSFLCALMFILFVPRSYIINNEGIRVFYGFKKCNFITWESIHSIDLRYDVRFDLFWFYKDFVVSHNNMKGYVRLIDTVTKTKRTELEIKKYWWKVIE